MTEEETKEVTLETRNSVELVIKGEKGEFTLSMPLGSKLEEAVKVTTTFVGALTQALRKFESERKEGEEASQGDVGEELEGE